MRTEKGGSTTAVELIDRIAAEWRPAFRKLTETGDVDDGFLEYLEQDEDARQAVDEALEAEAAKIRGLRDIYHAAAGAEALQRPRSAEAPMLQPGEAPARGLGIGAFLARKLVERLPTQTLTNELSKRIFRRESTGMGAG